MLNRQITENYLETAVQILGEGFKDTNRTGISTFKLPHIVNTYNLADNYVPIINCKKLAHKTAIAELLWIYRDCSNDVSKLIDKGIHIWDSWMGEDKTIGKAYGYQIGKYDQLNNLIKTIREDPYNRRMIMNMWNIEDLDEMNLQPCCFMTMWDVSDGKLNCTLVQRSADFLVGVPFNLTQYATLVHLIAHVTGLEAGKFTHFINNAHIYENQIEVFNEMYNDYKWLGEKKGYKDSHIILDDNVKEFSEFTILDEGKSDNIIISDYGYNNKKYKFEVAV